MLSWCWSEAMRMLKVNCWKWIISVNLMYLTQLTKKKKESTHLTRCHIFFLNQTDFWNILTGVMTGSASWNLSLPFDKQNKISLLLPFLWKHTQTHTQRGTTASSLSFFCWRCLTDEQNAPCVHQAIWQLMNINDKCGCQEEAEKNPFRHEF